MKYLHVLIFILGSSFAYGQNNVDLYRIERAGDSHLQKAEFSIALDTYTKYRIIANGHIIPGIEKKITNLNAYMQIYNDANKLYRSGKYIQAVEKFKQYRELFSGIAINSIDSKIEESLIQLEKNKAIATLNDKDKIIFGFEKNYLAEKDLAGGRLEQAKQGYAGAIKAVQGVRQKNSVTVQARERLSQIDRAFNIQQSVSSIDGIRQKIALLESYRTSGGVVIGTFEEQINAYAVQLDQSIAPPDQVGNLDAELNRIARNCDLNLLLTYVKNSRQQKYTTVPKDSLLGQLMAVREELGEIRTLILTGDNSQRTQYVFGGYLSIIEESRKVPIVGNALSVCFKKEYFELLYKIAKPLFEIETNIPLSREIAISAKEFAESAEEKSKINGLLFRINQRIGCSTIIKSTNSTLDVVQTNLRSCLASIAKKNLDIAVRAGQGCYTAAIEARIARLSGELRSLEARLERASTLKNDINRRLSDSKCDEVMPLLEELRNIESCNRSENQIFVETKSKEVIECKRQNVVSSLISSSKNMLNNLDTKSADIEKSRAGIKRIETEIEKADVLAIESEKMQVRELKARVVIAKNIIDAVEAGQRRQMRREYRRILKPELYTGTAYLVPGIKSAKETIRTSPTIQGNYEFGVSLRSLRRRAAINYAFSAGYERNSFQIAEEARRGAEDLQVDYATVSFPKNRVVMN